MSIRDILKHPLIYQAFQNAGGFFGARLRAMRAYLPMEEGLRVADIGCGPGFIVKHLPANIRYSGFDTDEKYVAYARANFGDKGRFVCRVFDEQAAREIGPQDIVLMNGVLHHLSDYEAHQTLAVIKQALASGGRLFTLDGCFANGQPRLARFLLEQDRGQHVRTREQYQSLLQRHFDKIEVHIENSLSWVPYTWIVMIGRG